MKKLMTFLLFLLPFAFGYTAHVDDDLTCSTPSNVTKTNETATSISFSWDACGCLSTGYRLKYVRQEDSYTSQDFYPTGTSYTFSNLDRGTYSFYFYTVCGEETSQPFIVIDDIIGN